MAEYCFWAIFAKKLAKMDPKDLPGTESPIEIMGVVPSGS
jgi:hypothetical protein